ncbi:NAD(P)/FAD-dependent oxidoreductase [Aminobacter aminovorans]|uniref:FAD-dependent glyphosate oxidase n=2 Tax=Aminobacter aminovorans TaxID=83263 RepID=A0AAC9ATI2_AMIAI|nr:FAD-binding oxidoreductase [Aminobacter aminovorans]AMS44924.1 FAD-dependent glyphosate oxidase [Aminobacter aminovorans]
MQPSTTAVIGAGMIGITSALWLQQAGRKVIVIDPNPPGTGASHGNAGCFNGSSVVPMSMPGMWTSVPRWMLDPLGPLSIRLAYMPTLFPWLWRFLRAGRREEVKKQAAALRALLGPTLPYLKQIARGAHIDDLICEQGHLYVYRSEKSLAGDRFGWQLRGDAGVHLDWLDQRQLQDFDPALSASYTQGVLIRENGHTPDPGGLVMRLAEYFVRQGGVLHQAKATGFRLDGGRLQSIETDNGIVQADSAVIAGGAHSNTLLKMLGDWVPLETERGYHVMISDPESQPRVPTCDASGKFVTTPMNNGLRLAGTVELAGLEFAPDWKRARALVKLGQKMLPGLPACVAEERLVFWMGHRPSLPDSLPVIDRSSRCPDIVYAFGHGHVGMTGAPMTGHLVADLILGRTPKIDIAPFRFTRF